MIQALRDRFSEHAMDPPAGAWDAISSQLALGAAASTDLMVESFRDRFQAHEADVDPGVWDGIQNSLSNAPADSVNELFRSRFQGHEVEVPAGAWEAIGSQLGQGAAAATGTGLSTGWLAASLVGLAGLGALVWQLNSTELVATAAEPKNSIEQTPALASAEVREERSAPVNEVVTAPSTNMPQTAVVSPSAAMAMEQPRAEQTAPENPLSGTAAPLAQAQPGSVVPSPSTDAIVPERMAPTTVSPASPTVEGRQVVATVLQEMTRPQEMTDHAAEHTVSDEPAVNDQEEPEVQPTMVAEDIQLFVPNVFSPNGDGENEHWEPQGSGYQRVMVRVFNPANGTLVFRSNDLRPWDGLDMSGQPCPAGTYLYAIELVDSLGHLQTRSETIALYR